MPFKKFNFLQDASSSGESRCAPKHASRARIRALAEYRYRIQEQQKHEAKTDTGKQAAITDKN